MEYHQEETTKRELLSLIGKLYFAAKVIPAGRIFLRRLIDLSTSVKKLHHHITLTAGARADIHRWHDFLPGWNGVSLMLQADWQTAAELNLFIWYTGLRSLFRRSIDHGHMVKGAALKVNPMERTFCNHLSSGHMKSKKFGTIA